MAIGTSVLAEIGQLGPHLGLKSVAMPGSVSVTKELMVQNF